MSKGFVLLSTTILAVTTIAGDGTSGLVDGTGETVRFNDLRGIAVDFNGNRYVSDCANDTIWKIR